MSVNRVGAGFTDKKLLAFRDFQGLLETFNKKTKDHVFIFKQKNKVVFYLNRQKHPYLMGLLSGSMFGRICQPIIFVFILFI